MKLNAGEEWQSGFDAGIIQKFESGAWKVPF
jgi:hypothetical protein